MPDGLRPYKAKRPDPGEPQQGRPETPSEQGFSHWNSLVTPERDTAAAYSYDKKGAESLREEGITSVAIYPGRGIFRGAGMLANLENKPASEAVVKSGISQHMAFETVYFDWNKLAGNIPYPTSLMGSIALMRQTFYDARWFAGLAAAEANPAKPVERTVQNAALTALGPVLEGDALALFATNDELDYARVKAIVDEFDLKNVAVLGNGYEYRRLESLSELGATLIVPLLYPAAPRVERTDEALDVSLEQLQHWELAPSNLAFLENVGIEF